MRNIIFIGRSTLLENRPIEAIDTIHNHTHRHKDRYIQIRTCIHILVHGEQINNLTYTIGRTFIHHVKDHYGLKNVEPGHKHNKYTNIHKDTNTYTSCYT